MGEICHLKGNKWFCQFRGRKCNILVGRRKFSVRTQEHLKNRGNLKNKREIEQERRESESVRGHPFMTFKKKIRFLLPLSTCVHMGLTPSPLWTSTRGRHEIDTNKTDSTMTYRS